MEPQPCPSTHTPCPGPRPLPPRANSLNKELGTGAARTGLVACDAQQQRLAQGEQWQVHLGPGSHLSVPTAHSPAPLRGDSAHTALELHISQCVAQLSGGWVLDHGHAHFIGGKAGPETESFAQRHPRNTDRSASSYFAFRRSGQGLHSAHIVKRKNWRGTGMRAGLSLHVPNCRAQFSPQRLLSADPPTLILARSTTSLPAPAPSWDPHSPHHLSPGGRWRTARAPPAAPGGPGAGGCGLGTGPGRGRLSSGPASSGPASPQTRCPGGPVCAA